MPSPRPTRNGFDSPVSRQASPQASSLSMMTTRTPLEWSAVRRPVRVVLSNPRASFPRAAPPHPPQGFRPALCATQALAEMLRDRDVVVLSDEIYSRIYYGGEAPTSIARFPGMLEKTIILDGFSKTYAMTGWRMGYGVMPTWIVEAVNKLMVNSNSCTASFTQRAGIAALTGPQDCVEQMVAEFRRRRDAICSGLNEVPGFHCALPGGAFYAFANVKETGIGSKELADILLYDAGVSCLNGGAFGEYGDGYIRFSYANSLANLEEAVARIQRVAPRWASVAAR